jgi:hypothetical protein
LSSFYRLTSISYTPVEGNPFTSSMEAYDYPFMATQFHPEKPMTAFYDDAANHSWESQRLNRYFADKLMSYARQNPNTWGTYQEVQHVIIQNCRHVTLDDEYREVFAFSSTEGCIP